LGVDLTVLEILGAASLEGLGATVAKLLYTKFRPQTEETVGEKKEIIALE
jgi:hypothetical protein